MSTSRRMLLHRLFLSVLQQVDSQQHNGRDGQVHQDPEHGAGFVIGAPELVDGGGNGGRTPRRIADEHGGGTVFPQSPGKGQNDTGQNPLTAGGHTDAPENIRIGKPQGLARLGQGAVETLESTPGCAVHEGQGHGDGGDDSSVPCHDKPDSILCKPLAYGPADTEDEDQKIPAYGGRQDHGQGQDCIHNALYDLWKPGHQMGREDPQKKDQDA